MQILRWVCSFCPRMGYLGFPSTTPASGIGLTESLQRDGFVNIAQGWDSHFFHKGVNLKNYYPLTQRRCNWIFFSLSFLSATSQSAWKMVGRKITRLASTEEAFTSEQSTTLGWSEISTHRSSPFKSRTSSAMAKDVCCSEINLLCSLYYVEPILACDAGVVLGEVEIGACSLQRSFPNSKF